MLNKNGEKEYNTTETVDLRKDIFKGSGKSRKGKDIKIPVVYKKLPNKQELKELAKESDPAYQDLIYDERISWEVREIFWIDLSELKNFLIELNKFKKRWQ